MTKQSQKILKLQKQCAEQEAVINSLTRENEDLRARLTGMLLLWRTSREIQRHRSELSPDDQWWHTDLESQMQVLEEQIVGAQLDLQRGRQEGGGGGGWAGRSGGAGRGWQGIGASSHAAVPPLGKCPGDDVLLSTLPHLALVEGGILRLEGATAEEVQQARSDSLDTALERWKGHIQAAQHAIAAGSEGTAALLWAAGLRMARTICLTAIWSFPVYIRSTTYHFVTLEPTVGLQDAPYKHWEAVVAAVRFTRWQALVLVEMLRMHRSKLQQLAEARAQLAAQLSAANNAAGAGGPSVAALAYRGEQSEEHDEVVRALEAHLRIEEQSRVVFTVAGLSLLTPSQLARAYCKSYPYPVNTPLCCNILEIALKFDHTFAQSAL